MKKLLVMFLIISLFTPSAIAAKSKNPDGYIPNVFIYEIPDEDEDTTELGDTSLGTNTSVKSDEENSVLLKSEIQYFDHLDVVTLDKTVNPKQINISKPQKISASSLKDYNKKMEATLASRVSRRVAKAQYRGEAESIISGINKNVEEKIGNFTVGTNFSSEVSTLSNLEYSSGLFTKYQKNNFSLKTTVYKDQVATYDLSTNNISVKPEFRINKALAINSVIKADLTRNRKTAQLGILLTPFAYKGNDRFNLELSAGQTFDETNALLKSKFEFSTKLEL